MKLIFSCMHAWKYMNQPASASYDYSNVIAEKNHAFFSSTVMLGKLGKVSSERTIWGKGGKMLTTTNWVDWVGFGINMWGSRSLTGTDVLLLLFLFLTPEFDLAEVTAGEDDR